ncbi:MAG: EAL domain-containing protein [Pseudomonadota bacterium]
MRSNSKGFLSLIWKAVLAVSIALIVATGSIIAVGTFTLDDYFSRQRELAKKYHQQALAGILQQARADVNSISNLLPTLIGDDVDRSQVLVGIDRLMDQFWFEIELESDIESAYLFSAKGDLVAEWGSAFSDGSLPSSMVGYVIQNEASTEGIQCVTDCIQFHAVPFLHGGRFAGVFVFGARLTNAVVQFKTITGADVGILIRNSMNKDDQGLVLEWGQRVVALTEFSHSFSLLRAFAKGRPEGLPTEAALFKYRNQTYEITILPFADLPASNQASLVIIDNVSDEVLGINTAKVLYAANGLLSLLLSGVILLVLLLRPTRRLRSLISVLPLLARKDYHAVTQQLPKLRKLTKFRDEIDVLDETTHSLVATLKKLDREVDERTWRLAERSNDLLQEKNFVADILDTAQVIIITLDHSGKVVMANKFTEGLTGFNQSELKGRFFFKLLAPDVSQDLIRESLGELVAIKRNAFHHECSVFAKQGDELYVSWFHTRLNTEGRRGAVVLSVGLDLTERRKAEKQLAWLADHDPLTNLYNRRRFEQEFERIIALSKRYGQAGALLFFDIDQFKFINDSSGHKSGDELLIRVAERLRKVTRSTDIVARLGGDEFAVVVPQVSKHNAERLAQKFYDEITSVKIKLGNNIHRISISAGLLVFPVAKCSVQDLMAMVDLAMYKVKDSGRGGWRIATIDDGSVDEVRRRVDWKGRIEKTLEEGRFVLFYQPIMHIRDASISHYECLLRMVDENGEIVPPGVFLGVAHQTGLINHIDRAVLKLAVVSQAELIRQGYDVIFSVNLSGEMMSNERFSEILKDLLEEHDVPPSKFIFEVTETQAVSNLHVARELIHTLKKLGAKFALDDFGVGFSSMNYLKELPVDYIKIDGSFVKNMTGSHEDMLFVSAIHNVANGLGKKTIAEFVENQETLQMLEEIGIDYAQGYGIGKPMPHPAFHSPSSESPGKSISHQKV